jgi:hypothetical protein
LLVLVSMIIVTAMAFQNAFGRLFGKRVYGPTTVMTGKSFGRAGHCGVGGDREHAC